MSREESEMQITDRALRGPWNPNEEFSLGRESIDFIQGNSEDLTATRNSYLHPKHCLR